VTLTIGIKALNEERHIAAALASAVAAAQRLGGDVVLADSGSTDRTIEIARTFPVRIVQLADHSERSCGAGAQLAFQYATGDYFYLMDGDQVLDANFIPAAISYLEAHPEIAAVGGHVREMNVGNQEFEIRAAEVCSDKNMNPGIVDRLDCGGLYRVAAIRDVEYFADRNLHAFEEIDLGVRLQSKNWKLARIDRLAVDHYGHSMDGYRLLWRRIASGYAGAVGEVLRGAIGRDHLRVLLRKLGHIRNGAIVIAWWLLLLAIGAFLSPLSTKLVAILLLLFGPIAVLTMRRRSLKLGLYSFATWNAVAFGLIEGFFRRRVPPQQPLASVVLTEAPRLNTKSVV
jgi:GT2 family glycosyltransferase